MLMLQIKHVLAEEPNMLRQCMSVETRQYQSATSLALDIVDMTTLSTERNIKVDTCYLLNRVLH